MAKIELELPDRIQNDIEQLVAQDEFVNWDEATEALLTRGISAYNVEEDESTGQVDEDLFQQAVEDQQDPAMRDDPDDEFTL